MSRFFTGSQQGIKAVYYSRAENKTELKNVYSHGTPATVQHLSVAGSVLAAAYSDGTCSTFNIDSEDVKPIQTWTENRLQPTQTFVGLNVSEASQATYSCTSNGTIRLTKHANGPSGSETLLSNVPTRLRCWSLSPEGATFAYGGDEVDLSVWDTEKGFATSSHKEASSSGMKRKRDELFPAEVWRAKNVPNDHLGLRQPVQVTSLSYLSSGPGSSDRHHLLVGTQLGDVRRYDTRAQKRPVGNWRIAKVGAIQVIEKGLADHEAFVSDQGSNLYSLDLRNGSIIYGYKGISGAITSIAASPSYLASTSLDRYTRMHSTFSPPSVAGEHQDRKGEIKTKVYMTSVPTVVVWDGRAPSIENFDATETDELWTAMETIQDKV
ncbi:WD40-repeat-containing domain protein [Mycena floridula]|nr:WD40-repeat-containing domain protein [Mycena floridula]